MIDHILTVGTITLATTCALLVKNALVELPLLPFRAIEVMCYKFNDFRNCDTVDEDAIQVPTFYAPPLKEVNRFFWVRITAIIVAALFGGIHCAGWNFPFPSHAELMIWRLSSLAIIIVPCTFVPTIVERFMGIDTITTAANIFLLAFGIGIYVVARLILFVEALTSLRHLPPGAYAAVEWTAFLLHM